MKLKETTYAVRRNSPQKLAENLRVLLKSHGLNANQLARSLGIPMMTVRRLLSGETTDPRISTLKLVADHFHLSVDELVDANHKRPRFIPLLNWDAAEKLSTIQELDWEHWKQWQQVSSDDKNPISPNAFALESRPSMYPRFPHNSIFIFDPDVKPTDGDMVLIRMKNNHELSMKELVIDPPQWQLHSIVSDSNTLQFSQQEHKIVGVNIMTILYNRGTGSLTHGTI